jgi:hypothetical protein
LKGETGTCNRSSKPAGKLIYLFPKKKKPLPLPAVVTLAREIRLAELEKKREKISRIETEAAKFEAVIYRQLFHKKI